MKAPLYRTGPILRGADTPGGEDLLPTALLAGKRTTGPGAPAVTLNKADIITLTESILARARRPQNL
jgi:hypothetical protein